MRAALQTVWKRVESSHLNVAHLGGPALNWLLCQDSTAIAVQETQLRDVAWHSTNGTCQAAGWEMLGKAAPTSVGSHTKGGTAILQPSGENVFCNSTTTQTERVSPHFTTAGVRL